MESKFESYCGMGEGSQSRAVIKRDKYGRLDESDYLRHASSYTRHKATVNVPRYDEKVCLLQVHFLPCDEVAVSTTCYGPNHPKIS